MFCIGQKNIKLKFQRQKIYLDFLNNIILFFIQKHMTCKSTSGYKHQILFYLIIVFVFLEVEKVNELLRDIKNAHEID